MIDRSLIHRLVVEEMTGYRIQSLNEGVFSWMGATASNIAQFLIAGATEYGLAATGVGAAAAPFAETAVDSLFTLNTAKSLIGSSTDLISSGLKGLKPIYDAARSLLSGRFNPSTLYNAVRQIIGRIDKAGGDKTLRKIKAKIDSFITKSAAAIGKCVNFLIPDTTIGSSASQSIMSALSAISANIYTAACTAIKVIGPLGEYITSPTKIVDLFKDMFPKVIELIESVATKVREAPDALWALGGPQALIMKRLGPTGLGKLAETMREKQPEILSALSSIVKIVVPLTLALLAATQSIMKGDYKENKKADTKGSGEKGAPPAQDVQPSPAGAPSPAVDAISEQINEVEISLLEMRLRRSERNSARHGFAEND